MIRWLVRFATLVGVLAVTYTLAHLTWRWLAPPPSTPLAAVPPSPVTTTAAVDYRTMTRWSLFGAEGSAPEPVAVAPETQLDLILAGVFYIAAGAKASASPFALIAVGRGVEQRFTVGDEVAPGVRIVAIEPRRVILDRRGRREALSLPIDTVAGAEAAPARAAAPSAEAAPPPPVERIDASDIATQLRQAYAQSPAALQELAVINPWRRNGELVGFRLGAGRNRRLLRQLNLRPGDVITEVNGEAMDSLAKGELILQALLTGVELDLTVLRGEQSRRYSFFLGS